MPDLLIPEPDSESESEAQSLESDDIFICNFESADFSTPSEETTQESFAKQITKKKSNTNLNKLDKALKRKWLISRKPADPSKVNKSVCIKSTNVRRHAKVPIMNIITHSSFEIDISLMGLAPDTDELVQRLAQKKHFKELAMVAKVFLFRFGFHKAFEGGLSSFRLYVLIDLFLSKLRRNEEKEIGHVFIEFLEFIKDQRNFSRQTEITIEGFDVEYVGCSKDRKIRDMFSKVLQKLEDDETLQEILNVAKFSDLKKKKSALTI